MEVNREVLKSSGRMKRRKAFRFFSYFSLCLAFVFALTNFLVKVDNLRIKYIYIAGNKNIESEKISESIKRIIRGEYFGIYPKNNIFIYPEELIANSIKREYLVVGDVLLSAALGTLSVEIKEREPSYLWCDDLAKTAMERNCYYLDASGFTFGIAPRFSGEIYLSFYGGNKKGGYMGRSILPSPKFYFVVRTKDKLSRIIKTEYGDLNRLNGVYLYNNGDYDLLFKRGGLSWKISFNDKTTSTSSDRLEDVLGEKLRATLNSPFFRAEMDKSGNNLEYIDLRFGKKVFYKFRQQ